MPSQRPLNNRLHVVVNGQRLSGEPTGVGRYIEMVLIELQELIDPDQIDLVLPQPLDPVRSAQLRVRSQVVASGLPALIWENVALPRRTRGVTVLFAPSYTLPLAFRGKSVLSNLGIYESMPQTFPWWHRIRHGPLYRYSARQASVVIANSESTKHDIASSYGVAPEKIRVVVPGVAECFHPRQPSDHLRSLKTELGFGDAPYLLFVGKLSHRRHVPELLQALDLLKQQHNIPHKLLIVGPNTLGWDIDGAIAARRSRTDIRYVAHLDWNALAAIYAGADLFVLPTEHEGLSFTILEAMASGAPVVTLDHAALEDGMRDAVGLAQSPEPEQLAAAVLQSLKPQRRQALSQRGLEVSRRFSWRENAKATLNIIQEVAVREDA